MNIKNFHSLNSTKFKIIFLVLLLSLFCFFAFIGINIYCIYQGEKICFNLQDIDQIPNRDTALILGCRIGSELLQWRLEAGAQLYHQKKIKTIIVSGDNRYKNYNEPEFMKNTLVQMGVPEEIIYCDYAGFRTLDSIIRCQYIFSQDNFIIISQKWHNYRAIMLAHHNKMPKVIAFNAKTCRFYRYLPEPPREAFARVLAFLDLYIINTKPKFYGDKINITK